MVGDRGKPIDITAVEGRITSVRRRVRRILPADVVIHAVLLIAGLVCVVPLINVLAVSLSQAQAIYRQPLLFVPSMPTLEAYKYIFKTPVLVRSFGVSLFATVVGTFLNLVFTTTAAYALSKVRVPGARLMLWIGVVPMLIGAGLIPFYVLLNRLGLINSVWVLILPSLVAPFNMILMRNFFWTIPDSLEESAHMDGANEFVTLARIIIPLSKAIIATIGLFYAVGHWNDYFTGLFFINDNRKWPLQVVLRSIIVEFNMMNMGALNVAGAGDYSKFVLQPENIRAATIIFSIVPIAITYPFLQKYFIKGVLIGSVKG
jgi:putative aldouronate transport system permease protein